MRADIAWSSVARRGGAACLLVLFVATACTTATTDRYRSLRDGWRRSASAALRRVLVVTPRQGGAA